MLRQSVTASRTLNAKASSIPKLPAALCSVSLKGQAGLVTAALPRRLVLVQAATAEDVKAEVNEAPSKSRNYRKPPYLTKENRAAAKELLAELKAKRDELQAGEHFTNQVLEKLVKNCFTDASDLKVWKSLTHEAVDKYGQALVDVVIDFKKNRDNGRLAPYPKPQVLGPEVKPPVMSNLTRFQAGETIQQIGGEKNTDNVLGDLAVMLAEGSDFDYQRAAQEGGVGPAVVQRVSAALDKAGENWISKVKLLAGEDISYGQIRMVAALRARNLSI